MKTDLRERLIKYIFLSLFCVSLCATNAPAQTTAFTYQGKLTDNSTPANGSYNMSFALCPQPSGGTCQTPQNIPNVAISNGVFTVQLDFGGVFDGSDQYLQISVFSTATNAYVPLSPRQKITSAPYSIKSLNAATADTATNSLQLGGTAANQFVQTNNPALTDARDPKPGSDNYIQNTASPSPQSNANFNIAGTGAANAFNAATQYNIANNRVLSVAGSFNFFAGVNAGANNSSGNKNTFAGFGAGSGNTSGNGLTFFGYRAGEKGVSVCCNSFFGFGSGSNTTGGGDSYFGYLAGNANTTGGGNTYFGDSSGALSTTGSANSFFGQNSGANTTTGDGNNFFG